MRGVLSFLVAAAVLAAGCSTGGSPGSDGKSASTMSTGPLNETIDNLTVQVITTDTLFLLTAPQLVLASPDNETILATQTASTPQAFAWNITANGTANITGGRLSLWLLLPRSAVQTGAANDPACTLHWTVTVTYNGTARGLDGGCASLGVGSIPPGSYRVEVDTPPLANPIALGPGGDVRLVVALGFTVPNGQAFLMGGTEQYDSRLRLDGLAEPLPPVLPTNATAAANATTSTTTGSR